MSSDSMNDTDTAAVRVRAVLNEWRATAIAAGDDVPGFTDPWVLHVVAAARAEAGVDDRDKYVNRLDLWTRVLLLLGFMVFVVVAGIVATAGVRCQP